MDDRPQLKKTAQIWEARSKHGRDRTIVDPLVLREAVLEYFQWVDDNPLYEAKLVSFQGISTLEDVPRKRPYTVGALCLFLGIDRATWGRWRSCKDEDFRAIVLAADEAIYYQKFEGAAAGFFNPLIISRDLGLRDVTATELTGKGGGPIQTESTTLDASTLPPEARLALLRAMGRVNDTGDNGYSPDHDLPEDPDA